MAKVNKRESRVTHVTSPLEKELPTAYVTDEDGNKLYVWSHIDIVRYNSEKTLKQKLMELEDKIGSGGGGIGEITAEMIYEALGYYPVNVDNENYFSKKVGINQLVIGNPSEANASLFKPLYAEDGRTVIGHILE